MTTDLPRVVVMGFDDNDQPLPYHARLVQIEGDTALIAWTDDRVTPSGSFERLPLNRVRLETVGVFLEMTSC